MSEFTSPSQLNPQATAQIEVAIGTAVSLVDVNVMTHGFVDHYSIERQRLPDAPRLAIRALANGVYPPVDATTGRLHPFGRAVECGMVLGAAISLHAIDDGSWRSRQDKRIFLNRFTSDVRALYQHAYQGVGADDRRYELDDMLRLAGGNKADYLRSMATNALIHPLPKTAHPKIDDQKEELYLNAAGYALTGGEVVLTYRAIKNQQKKDRKGRSRIRADLNSILHDTPQTDDGYIPASNLFPDLFPGEE
jgi:hypothetical protein